MSISSGLVARACMFLFLEQQGRQKLVKPLVLSIPEGERTVVPRLVGTQLVFKQLRPLNHSVAALWGWVWGGEMWLREG